MDYQISSKDIIAGSLGNSLFTSGATIPCWFCENEENTTLLLSVYNPVIIPDRILNKNNIKAINLHHSLLPYHPGMYSEAWAIFEQDKYSGITRHLMTSEIDAGEIIIQKKVPIDAKTTSYNLLYNLNEVAYEAFEEVVEDIMYNSLKVVLQKKYLIYHCIKKG